MQAFSTVLLLEGMFSINLLAEKYDLLNDNVVFLQNYILKLYVYSNLKSRTWKQNVSRVVNAIDLCPLALSFRYKSETVCSIL